MFNYRNHIFYGLLDGTGGLTPIDDEPEETSNLPEDDKFWEYVEDSDPASPITELQTQVAALQPFVVTFSGTTADGDAACDKTLAEVEAAINAGKNIVYRFVIDHHGIIIITGFEVETSISDNVVSVLDLHVASNHFVVNITYSAESCVINVTVQ